ncbi:hypothetical protein [Aureivirga marina]|uniref:hypothetical protein n=1 Tax=Aureivirga marina TaxID=1182451 RepID=UPI0018C91593|nr:hypothetical protein [Aureivirga marina]
MLSQTEYKLLEIDKSFERFQLENHEKTLEDFLSVAIKQSKFGLLNLKLYLKRYHQMESKEASKLLAKISMKNMFFLSK